MGSYLFGKMKGHEWWEKRSEKKEWIGRERVQRKRREKGMEYKRKRVATNGFLFLFSSLKFLKKKEKKIPYPSLLSPFLWIVGPTSNRIHDAGGCSWPGPDRAKAYPSLPQLQKYKSRPGPSPTRVVKIRPEPSNLINRAVSKYAFITFGHLSNCLD